MRKHLILLLGTTCMGYATVKAQDWIVGGNNLTANGTLGTNTNYSVIFETNGLERGRITNGGNWGIGSLGTSSKFTVNSAANTSPFLARIAGANKFIVNGNGGVSVGSGSTPPANGLYVAGRVGIGITSPANALDILNSSSLRGINVNNNFTGKQNRTGVYARSVNNPGYGFGVQAYGGWYGAYARGEGGSNPGNVYGIQGSAIGSAGSRYGVYGSATGGSFNAAGYFNGAVWASSYKTISDRKFKEGITPLEHTLQQVMKLKPAAYQFKTGAYQSMQLPTGKQIGLIADEVKQVFPELVQQAVHPAEFKEDSREELSPEIHYEGLNYQGLIPILIAAVQELKTENDQQQQQINELKETVAKLLNAQNVNGKNLTSAFLKGSIPNPSNGTALIRYYVPHNSGTAHLVFTDTKGAIIKSITLNHKGDGQLSVDMTAWTAGTYTYTIYINGTQADSGKLVIVR
jgi:hypothetical protein